MNYIIGIIDNLHSVFTFSIYFQYLVMGTVIYYMETMRSGTNSTQNIASNENIHASV